MIYTVTFNPSLDYIIKVQNFGVGKVNRTTEETIIAGGKGINVSVVLNNLGLESTALGFCAGFTGEKLKELLADNGVKSDFVSCKYGTTRINVKIKNSFDADNGENIICKKANSDGETEINGMGPSLSDEELKAMYSKLEVLNSGDYLVLAGSIPSSLPKTIYEDIMQFIDNKGVNVVVDATKELLMNVLPYQPFLIKPNNVELAELFDTQIENKDAAAVYAKKLVKMGARNVLVSMGKDGAVLVTESGETLFTDAPKGKVVYTVGAGDSMVAGFIAGFIEKNDYNEALKLGICAGSATAFSETLATGDEIYALRDNMR